jgi:hypothetical protein
MSVVKLVQASALLVLAVLATSEGRAEESPVIAPGDSVANTSQEDWSRAWWQWAASFEQEGSPVADRTGESCGLKQSGPVWFLAGTYGTKRTIRTCTVPHGKYLFFPLINYVVGPPPSGRPVSCLAVMSSAAQMTEHPSGLLLEIDGVRAPELFSHRLATRECFDIGLLSESRVRVYPAAANGYYIMLRPLPPGTHVLNFGGALPSMLQGVTYTLTVE